MKVDLSIDFDFFIREDIEWDWGHREDTLFLNTIWPVRYANNVMDIRKETDVDKFADFHPIKILPNLKEKGFDISKTKELFLCESHLGIVQSFDNDKIDADILISLDAHHDAWDKKEVDCGSWLNHFMKKKLYRKAIVVYPKWKDKRDDGKKLPKRDDVGIVYWHDFPKVNYEVQRIFLCRSGCWVPPHHDADFSTMATILSFNSKMTYIVGKIDVTKSRKIDWEGVMELRKANRTLIQQIQQNPKMKLMGGVGK